MRLTYEPLTLELRNTFRIAHGASDQRHNVLVRLVDAEGHVGLGEAAAVTYHGETQQGIMAYLQTVAGKLEDDAPGYLDDVLEKLPPGSQAARAAVDIALHDLWGQRLGQPLYRLWGLNPEHIPPTSFTIAMDTPSAMAERARQADWPILKVKIGSPDDVAMLSAIRQATSAKIRVDANAGWTREEAAERIPRLAGYGLEIVEQPLPVGDIEGLRWLKEQHFGVPIFADESIKTTADVVAHAGAVEGV
ncbi:MAG: dipeptide epimerase, partial [Anaerolineae bacterium]|nr:dipeptide epimerase [Anaerolineae bacterium]